MELGLPWVEKYRPMALKEVVGQADITKRLESYVRTRNLPNMMFSGPAGVGKTSASVAMARELFGPGFEQNFLELNASDQRGIDVVRSTIKDFARLQTTETIYRLFMWRKGTYEFTAAPVDYDEQSYEPIRAENLLMEGFRMVDEWPSVRKVVPSSRCSDSIVMASAGHTASHNLHAIQRSSPFG